MSAMSVDKLRKFSCQNGFGIKLIDECISKKLDSISYCLFGFKTDYFFAKYIICPTSIICSSNPIFSN